MLSLDELENQLGYKSATHYYRPREDSAPVGATHLFRTANEAGVHGIYVFETCAESKKEFPKTQPIVYLAKASTLDEAKKIHGRLWNLSYAPFIIIKLPNQIRVYTGFDYSTETEDRGLLEKVSDLNSLRAVLAEFSADALDTGQVWQSRYGKQLDPKQRVDRHLLQNLKKLGDVLIGHGELNDEIAHTLIGKYVYFHYLRERSILTDEWLREQQIDTESVFKRTATIEGLQKLSDALEKRFNGRIFPLDFSSKSLTDQHISWVASVFMGDELRDSDPKPIRQLHLPFKAYDFRYIPVETLSAIYEQFITAPKEKGAIYTPEFLADYLLSEVEKCRPLERGMKILDPACGSGVFLVLAYKRLIEKETKHLGRDLAPKELCSILQESIYGVERERDACFVTEFSLILTLLNYIEPPDLQKLEIQFPELHNRRIFEGDFFDDECAFWQGKVKFDCVIGNPPWTELKPNIRSQQHTLNWIKANKGSRPVAGYRVAEAFSWRVMDILKDDGIVGLILPATSLVNHESQKYREQFFTQHEVFRITNFANLRDVLFDRRGTLPAATAIYRRADDSREKPYITHYAPFSTTQVFNARGKPWIITINEDDIQTISPYEAEKGETSLWKLALWGTHRDKRTLERIAHLFPATLKAMCKKKGWSFHEGVQLRDPNNTDEELEYIAELKGKKRFETKLMTKSLLRFSIAPEALKDVPDVMCYVRKQGGMVGLTINSAPHIILSPSWLSYVAYSDEDFVIPPRQMGIKGEEKHADELRALSIYLSSSLAAYYLFFHVPQWGVFRQAKQVITSQVGNTRVPEFAQTHLEKLANFHREIVALEKREVGKLRSGSFGGAVRPDKQVLSRLRAQLQKQIDDAVFGLFNVPYDIRLMVEDFVQTRLPLDNPSEVENVTGTPTDDELLAYARELRDELDAFAMGEAHHRVTINYSRQLVECVVELTHQDEPIPVDKTSVKSVARTMKQLHSELKGMLTEAQTQWVYVQRGLRIFDGPRIHIYKPPRLIDWTRTQALNDADDIIGEVLSAR